MFHCSEILRKTITQQVAARLVLPNKIIVPLTPDIPLETLKVPEPEVRKLYLIHNNKLS